MDIGSTKRVYSTVVVFLVIIATQLFSVPAYAALTYTGIPAHPRPDQPRSKSIFIHTIEPGVTQDDGVLIINNADEQKELIISAVGSVNSSDGAISCAQRRDERRGVGLWIDLLSGGRVTLAAEDSVIIPFSVTVPEGTPAGEYNGCITIEEYHSEEELAGLAFTTRVGIRVAVTVPGDLVRQLENPELALYTREDVHRGTVSMARVTIENTGTTSIDTDVFFRAYPLPLFFLKREFGGMYPIFRGNGRKQEWHFDMPQLPWGGLYLLRASFMYDTEVGSSDQIALHSSPTFLFVTPVWWALILELLVLAFIVLVGITVILRRRNLTQRQRKVQLARKKKAIAKQRSHAAPTKTARNVRRRGAMQRRRDGQR